MESAVHFMAKASSLVDILGQGNYMSESDLEVFRAVKDRVCTLLKSQMQAAINDYNEQL